MKTTLIALSALSFAMVPAGAEAAQFVARADIFTGAGVASRYVGGGGTVQPSNRPLGSVADGGADSFDNFGFYNSGTTGLAQTRHVELLAGNTFRFFDTFTNTGSTAIRTSVNFFGNLGSDGDELVSVARNGLIVTCQDDGAGLCVEDAVLALVSGNNGLAAAAITPDRYNVRFALDVAAGQSVSLLNFAFLARDEAGPLASDVTLARTTGEALLAAPRTEGLSAAQIAGVVNFRAASAVPEPTTWAMMLLGFAAMALALRRPRFVERVAG
jgi:hypothetical protein